MCDNLYFEITCPKSRWKTGNYASRQIGFIKLFLKSSNFPPKFEIWTQKFLSEIWTFGLSKF